MEILHHLVLGFQVESYMYIMYTSLSFNLSRPAPVAYSSRCDPAASAAAAAGRHTNLLRPIRCKKASQKAIGFL